MYRDHSPNQRWHFRIHLARLTASGLLGLAALRWGDPWMVAIAAVALFLAAFALSHDLIHSVLGLSERQEHLALAAAAALMLMSGHALRVMHRLHHARPFSDGDLEGATTHMSLARALRASPGLSWQLRLRAYRLAGPTARAWQRRENALNALTLLALLAWPESGLWVYALVVVLLQLAMPIWGGYIPHRTPEWLARAARALAFTRSVTVLSLAFHALHHARPDVPCLALPGVAEQGAAALRPGWCRSSVRGENGLAA